jgi:colicin import membrane protein
LGASLLLGLAVLDYNPRPGKFPQPPAKGHDVDQAQLELQLKVWKELAISKQVLMRGAAESLKLDPDCSQDVLKKALEAAIKKGNEADTAVAKAQSEAKIAISAAERKLEAALKAQATAEATIADVVGKHENATQAMAVERASTVKEVQNLKAQLAEKEKALKAINIALADTPENVIKKMNVLKKQRQEEADARRAVEGSFGTLRKEKQTQDQEFTAAKANTTKLVSTYRDLHAAATTVFEQLKPLVEEGKLPTLPNLDANLLDDIELTKEQKEAKEKENRKKK